ncbi:MAG: ClpXP protease specificity-enhancing factor SspB [Nitratireductor sp.]
MIRKVLEEVERAGTARGSPLLHYLCDGFPGAAVKRMRERHPEEMTIVIQHSFWNLETGDTGFEIDLSFDDIRERLRIPYASIQGFFDLGEIRPAIWTWLEIEPEAVSEA